mmetsp:Transcript_2643/g.4556  ORF Transcript_2643/g.4556 Transcript_2643/m.4556 type:complete len:214 (+) Transcript_2643:380-1021(+)
MGITLDGELLNEKRLKGSGDPLEGALLLCANVEDPREVLTASKERRRASLIGENRRPDKNASDSFDRLVFATSVSRPLIRENLRRCVLSCRFLRTACVFLAAAKRTSRKSLSPAASPVPSSSSQASSRSKSCIIVALTSFVPVEENASVSEYVLGWRFGSPAIGSETEPLAAAQPPVAPVPSVPAAVVTAAMLAAGSGALAAAAVVTALEYAR